MRVFRPDLGMDGLRRHTWDCNPHPFGQGLAGQRVPGAIEALSERMDELQKKWGTLPSRDWTPSEFRATMDGRRLKFCYVVRQHSSTGSVDWRVMGTWDGRRWCIRRAREG